MMKRNFIYLSLFIMVAMVSSCSSTKKMTKSVTVGDLTEREYVDKIIDNSNKFDVIWAKSVFTLIFDKKDPNFTADFFNPNTPPYQICHSVALIYRTIKEALPQEEVGPVFRAMFGSLSNM